MTGLRSSQRLRPDARHRRGAAAVAVERGRSGAELDAPAPDCLIRNVYATLQHQLLDLAQAQVEPDVEPDNMSDDLRWKPVALIADFLCLHRHRLSPDQ